MEKLLLAAFLSALAGFLTAIISVVKLVNEKESKTTDYRQAWTDSVRKSFSELIANLNTQAALLRNEGKILDQIESLDLKSKAEPSDANIKSNITNHKDILKQLTTTLHETRKKIFESYAFTRLHFKPNDLSFNRVEQKFDVIDTLLDKLHAATSDSDRIEVRQQVYAGTKDITDYARDILKTEWETVKRGEPAYKRTKKWSIGGSIVMLLLLLSIGVHVAFMSNTKEIMANESLASKIIDHPSKK